MDLLEARRRKFNVEEHYRMGEVGILPADSLKGTSLVARGASVHALLEACDLLA